MVMMCIFDSAPLGLYHADFVRVHSILILIYAQVLACTKGLAYISLAPLTHAVCGHEQGSTLIHH